MYTAPRHWSLALVVASLAAAVAPLFVGLHLPAVDAPQHLFLVNVFSALDDPASPYHATYVANLKATYVTLYLGVKWLGTLVGVERGLQLFSALSVLSIVGGTALLARAFGRPAWAGLLAIPFAYTDNFYWGLFSFHASIGPCLLTCALFAMVLDERDARRGNGLAVFLALSLLTVQLTHAAAMVLPGLALPLLLLTTRFDLRRAGRAIAALVPGVAVFAYWLLSSVHRDRTLGKPGEPWKAAAPLFETGAWKFNSTESRVRGFWELLSNGFWDWADRWPVTLSGAVLFLLAIVGLAAFRRSQLPARDGPTPWARWLPTRFDPRPFVLLALVVALYFALPTDIPGYMYQLHFRYAQVVALFAVAVIVVDAPMFVRVGPPLAAAVAIASGLNLSVLFARFDLEARAFDTITAQVRPGARIQHLVVRHGSRVATHAVYVHYAALAAMRANGVPSFSLAIDPSFPVNHKPGAKPPGSPWEWRPLEFTWDEVARHYDHYLARGAPPPERLFGTHAGEVEVAAKVDEWVLYRRRTPVNNTD